MFVFQIDVDGDGTISLGEFKTMMERLMESNEEDDRELLEDTFNVSYDILGGVSIVQPQKYPFPKWKCQVKSAFWVFIVSNSISINKLSN